MTDRSGSSSPVDRRSRNLFSRFRRNSRTSNSESSKLELDPGSSPTSVHGFTALNDSSQFCRVPTGKREKEGLWRWPSADEDEPSLIDIVAVHGLQGDYERTWEKNGEIWLRDFLGDKIPNVQVLSFGYNSLILSPGWTHQLEDFARQLLQAVKNYRNDNDRRSHRPIIFLGHSLGGLIIKKALIIAHARSFVFSNILEHTKGLIFMGTPHRGADPAKWASMLQSILGPIGAGPSTNLYGDLKEKSRTLVQINNDFPERGEDMQILSFYEMQAQPELGSLVVEPSSAILGLPNEVPIPLNANHRSMCRFGREDVQSFAAVWEPIRDMVRSIRDGGTQAFKQKRRDLLAELYGRNFVNFSSTSIEPAEGTCRWILSHPMYASWRSKPLCSSLLWITGGPGSGKSVISDFVVEELKSANATVCAFSFTEGKSSMLDLLGQMVSQALLANDDLCFIAIEQWEMAHWVLSWDLLCSFWARICEKAKGGEIFWVIDALDECNEIDSIKGFLNSILVLLSKLNITSKRRLCFRVLLTSRPETWRQLPHLRTSETPVTNRIILEDEAAIEKDMSAYIHEEVLKLTPRYIPEDEREDLESQLCSDASRSFIWVKLTLKSIQTELTYTKGKWGTIIDAIPRPLEGTYERLLSQLSGTNGTSDEISPLPSKIKRLLQFVVGAQGFLTVSELSMLFALEDGLNTIAMAESKAPGSGLFFDSVYGSFLRLVRGSDGIQQVRLIHETARKHLLLPESKSAYALDLVGCHVELAKGCISYLVLDDLQECVSGDALGTPDNHPLLKYAILQWALHVREAESTMDDDLFGRVVDMYRTNSQRFHTWSEMYWKLSTQSPGKSAWTTLHMCAYNGHIRILRRLLEDLDPRQAQSEIDKVDSAGDTALHYAAAHGRSGAVEVLLDAKADASVRNKAGLAGLHKAVIANNSAVVDALVRGGANIDIRTAGEEAGRTVLHLAVEDGLQNMVGILVRHGANLQIRDSTSSTAAAIAFRKGYGEIYKFLLTEESQEINSAITELDQAIMNGDIQSVQRLLDCGSSLTMPDTRGSTPLHRAAMGENPNILKLLLGTTGDPDIRDDDLMTPLHLAARYGRRDAVEVLISRNADRNAASADQSTPLHEAALAGNRVIVDRLLDAKADQNLVDDKDRTPLFCASSFGFDKVVETLLRKANTSKIELTGDDKNRLPIHIAAKNGHKTAVQVLLSRNGASLEMEDQKGSTPLSLACSGPSKYHAETVRFLVENGAIISHKQRNGATPILLAAETGNVQSMKYLLGEGCSIPGLGKANVDERDSTRSTPLTLAARNGHEDAVLLLLSHGAQDVSKWEEPGGRDPLSWAAGHGMIEAVNKLLSIPNIPTNAFDRNDRTPLSWAAGNGHTTVVMRLLLESDQCSSKAKVNTIDTGKRTPLSWAAGAGHKEVVELLLRHEADQNIRGKNTAAPIVWAAKGGHLDIVSLLLSQEPSEETKLSEDGGSLLLVAAVNGKNNVVTFLLEQPNTDINHTNKNGHTPLMQAAIAGHEEVVTILLAHGADVHKSTHNTGSTALISAASWGRLAIVKMILKHDESTLNATSTNDESVLYMAVRDGYHEIVKLLLKAGCDIETCAKDSDTLVHVAARGGYHLVLRTLLGQAKQCLNQKNSRGETPLMLAVENHHEQCVVTILQCCQEWGLPLTKLLIRDSKIRPILSAATAGGSSTIVQHILTIDPAGLGAIGIADHKGLTPLTYALTNDRDDVLHLLLKLCPESVNQRVPSDGRTPLLWAVTFGDEEIVRTILESPNVDRYAKDKRGRNSLWLAVVSGKPRIVKMLLSDRSGQSEARKIWMNELDISSSLSPLQLAVRTGFMEMLQLLLADKDTELNKASPDGTTAFLTAVIHGHEPVVRTLAAIPVVDTTATDCDGHSALMLASQYSHLKIVRFLLKEYDQARISVDATDRKMKTALCHAARSQEPAIVELLLESGASVHQRVPPYNRNPLMLAAESGSVRVVEMIIKRKELDLDTVDDLGFTALTIAAIVNKGNLVRLLLNRGADPNVRSTRSQRTPLMEAAYVGGAAAVRELLLSPRLDFSCVNDANRTATWFIMNGPPDEAAAIANNSRQFSSTAEIFLEFEPSKLHVNEIDIEGQTLLLILSGRSKPQQIRRILELGADFKYQTLATRSSAFHVAAECCQIRNLSELLEFSMADDTFDCKDLDHATPLSYAVGNYDSSGTSNSQTHYQSQSEPLRYHMARMLLDRTPEINSATLKHKSTPLMFAAQLGFEHIVGLLLENHANVGLQDRHYHTGLSLAVVGGHIATVLRLLEAGAPYNIKDKTGATLVILAAQYGHLSLVRIFLESKYQLATNHRDRSGRTALSHAAENNRLAVVHYLLKHHNKPEAPMVDTLDRQDQNALVWACKQGHCDILSVLIEYGANSRSEDRNKRMPLSHAAEHGCLDVMRQLLEQENAEDVLGIINWRDDAGRTALSWAAEQGHSEATQILLEWGADALLSDKKQQTPQLLAKDKGHTKVARILEVHSALVLAAYSSVTSSILGGELVETTLGLNQNDESDDEFGNDDTLIGDEELLSPRSNNPPTSAAERSPSVQDAS